MMHQWLAVEVVLVVAVVVVANLGIVGSDHIMGHFLVPVRASDCNRKALRRTRGCFLWNTVNGK